jgi:hypothetical protein
VPIQKAIQTKGTDKYDGNVAPKETEYSVKLTGSPVVTIADKNKSVIDYVFDWGPWVFNALLAVVGVIGIVLACRTLRTMGKQAELTKTQARLMDRQTRLQEISMMQWVSVKDWKAELREPTNLVARARLCITFSITNESNFPLNMNATFSFGFYDSQPIPHETGPVLLLPRYPHRATVFVPISRATYKSYGETDALIVGVKGEISHVGILGREGPFMKIGGEICYSRDGTTFEYPTMTLTPKDDSDQGDKKAD